MTVSYFDERAAIQERMEEIKVERRSLTEEYDQLKADLRLLDERDRQAQERGFSYVAPFDVNAAVAVMSEAVATMKNLVPSVSMEQVVAEMTKKIATQFSETIEETTKKTERKFMSEQQEHDTYRTMKKSRVDYAADAHKVANALKELGRPVSFKTLFEILEDEDHEFKWSNKSLGMSRVMELDPRIEKIGKGKSAVFHLNTNGGL